MTEPASSRGDTASRVLVVDPGAEWWRERLTGLFPGLPVDAARSHAEAGPFLERAEVLVTMGIHLGPDVTTAMPNLRWVHCLLAGWDQMRAGIDARPDVLLTTTRGVHGPQMTEMALLHMLAHARRLPEVVRQQAGHVWRPVEQRLLSGRTVTIVGLGAVGRALAPVCAALGMSVQGVSRDAGPVPGVGRLFDRGHLVDAVRDADFVVLLLPAGPDTDGLVDADVLAAMKPTAHLTSLGRATVLDHAALLAALRAGRLAGAGLDVLPTEPPVADDPLWDLPNVLLTPHLGGRSDRYPEQALTVVEPNLRAWLAGRPDDLRNVVDRTAPTRPR